PVCHPVAYRRERCGSRIQNGVSRPTPNDESGIVRLSRHQVSASLGRRCEIDLGGVPTRETANRSPHGSKLNVKPCAPCFTAGPSGFDSTVISKSIRTERPSLR